MKGLVSHVVRFCSALILANEFFSQRYITATEWKRDFGGAKDVVGTKFKRLPFDCCALTLLPFETPVATKEGHIFDLL